MSENPNRLLQVHNDDSSPPSPRSSRSSLEADDADSHNGLNRSSQYDFPTVSAGRRLQGYLGENSAIPSGAAVADPVRDERNDRREKESRHEADGDALLAENRRLREDRMSAVRTDREVNAVFLTVAQGDEGPVVVELQEELEERTPIDTAEHEARPPHRDGMDYSFLELDQYQPDEPELRQLLELGIRPRYCQVKLQQLHVDLR